MAHALNLLAQIDGVFPSSLTRSVQALTLSLVHTPLNLFHLMVHFPQLISLTLVWEFRESQAHFIIPETFGHHLGFQYLTYFNLQGLLQWAELLPFLQRCPRLAFIRIIWPHDGDMSQLLGICRRLQYLWFDNRHQQVPSAIPITDAITVPHPANANHWSHLRQIVAYHPTPAVYRGIIATFQDYQHVYLNTIRIRISHRLTARDIQALDLHALALLPLLSEFVFDIHPRCGIVQPLLHNHVLPLLQAAPRIERCCIRIMHRDDEQTGIFIDRNIPVAIMARIMHHMPSLRHLCLHAHHPVTDAVYLLRQLQHHQVRLQSFDWLGHRIGSVDLFAELARMPGLEWVALGTKDKTVIDSSDFTIFLDHLAASQTITWLVFTNVSCFRDTHVFQHIPASVTQLNLYDCAGTDFAGWLTWAFGHPERKVFQDNDWTSHTQPVHKFPPPRSFFISHEQRYGS